MVIVCEGSESHSVDMSTCLKLAGPMRHVDLGLSTAVQHVVEDTYDAMG